MQEFFLFFQESKDKQQNDYCILTVRQLFLDTVLLEAEKWPSTGNPDVFPCLGQINECQCILHMIK